MDVVGFFAPSAFTTDWVHATVYAYYTEASHIDDARLPIIAKRH